MSWFRDLLERSGYEPDADGSRRDPIERALTDAAVKTLRNAWRKGVGPEGLLGDVFELEDAVGTEAPNRRPDVAGVETILGRTGHLDLTRTEGPTGRFDARIDRAIRGFQKDQDLKVDGLINPGGPTIGTLRMMLQVHRGSSISSRLDRSDRFPRQGTVVARNLRSHANSVGTDVRPSAQNLVMPEEGREKGEGVLLAQQQDAGYGNVWSEAGDVPDLRMQELRRAQSWMDEKLDQFRRGGFRDAADNLEHYLSGMGGTKLYTREHARSFSWIASAEKYNRDRIEKRTFLGKTIDNPQPKKLKMLEDGERLTFSDEWDTSYKELDFGRAYVFGDRNFALAHGRTNLYSSGNFKAERRGDRILIDGEVTHFWGIKDERTGKLKMDRYDFHGLQPGATEARVLERYGKAKSFDFGAEWKQRVRGSVPIENGQLGKPKVTWTDIDR